MQVRSVPGHQQPVSRFRAGIHIPGQDRVLVPVGHDVRRKPPELGPHLLKLLSHLLGSPPDTDPLQTLGDVTKCHDRHTRECHRPKPAATFGTTASGIRACRVSPWRCQTFMTTAGATQVMMWLAFGLTSAETCRATNRDRDRDDRNREEEIEHEHSGIVTVLEESEDP